jgi:hypothetical protein
LEQESGNRDWFCEPVPRGRNLHPSHHDTGARLKKEFIRGGSIFCFAEMRRGASLNRPRRAGKQSQRRDLTKISERSFILIVVVAIGVTIALFEVTGYGVLGLLVGSVRPYMEWQGIADAAGSPAATRVSAAASWRRRASVSMVLIAPCSAVEHPDREIEHGGERNPARERNQTISCQFVQPIEHQNRGDDQRKLRDDIDYPEKGTVSSKKHP